MSNLNISEDKTKKGGVMMAIANTVLYTNLKNDNNAWVVDSGATAHMCNDLDLMHDLSETTSSVGFGNDDNDEEVTIVGKVDATITNKDGSIVKLTLLNVGYVKTLVCNLVSIPMAMNAGYKVQQLHDNDFFSLINNDVQIDCHVKHQSGDSFLMGLKLQVNHHNQEMVTRMKLHEQLGHPGMKKVEMTAKDMNIELEQEEQKVCEPCALGKSRRLNLNKTNTNPVDSPGGRLYIDTSWINTQSGGGSNYWVLIVDEQTQMSWSIFVAKKSELESKIITLLHTIINDKKKILYIRMDNAQENYQLKKKCIEEHLEIEFEFTSRSTPQHNGVVERKFQTLYNRMMATLNRAGLTSSLRKFLWAECAFCVTILENVCVKNGSTKSPFELFYNKKFKVTNELRTFGEVGVVKSSYSSMQSKIKNKGITMLFCGYSLCHGTHVYKMLNLETNRTVITRDIVWLNKTYGEWALDETDIEYVSTGQDVISDYSMYYSGQDDHDVEIEEIEQHQINELTENEFEVEPLLMEIERPRLLDGLSQRNVIGNKLRSSHNTRSTTKNYTFLSAMTYNSDLEYKNDPQTFKEAWDNPIMSERKEWREAIEDEFETMENKNVWTIMNKNELQPNQNILQMRWVFKTKNDGRHRARLVAKGFKQIEGVDFIYSHSPVLTDITIRILLTLSMSKNYTLFSVDITKAFLESDLEEDNFISIPPGYYECKDE